MVLNAFNLISIMCMLSLWYDQTEAGSERIPTLIPRGVIFAPPDYSRLSLSPDGQRLSFIGYVNNTPNVYVKRLPDGTSEQVTNETGRGVDCAYWSFDNETLLYYKDKDGDENWRLYALNLSSKRTKLLAGSEKVSVWMLKKSIKHPYRIVIGINDRKPQYHDVYEVDIRTGKKKLMLYNDRFVEVFVDDDLKIRFVTIEAGCGRVNYYAFKPPVEGFHPHNESSTPLLAEYKRVTFENHKFIKLLKIHKSGKIAYWLDNNDGEDDLSSLVSINLETGEKNMIFKPNQAEINHILYHPVSGEPLMITIYKEKPQYVYLSEHFGIKMEQIRDELILPERGHETETDVHFVHSSADFSYWIFAVSSDQLPFAYFSHNTTSKATNFMFHSREALLKYHMADMQVVHVPIGDNLTQVCYLTMPNRNGTETGSGGKRPPVPTILHVHGGPWHRDFWGFVDKVQYFASRGYATLRCNFRSSSGFGKKFLNAGTGEWGGKMQQDLTDAANWLISEKIAIPAKIAIYGGSYGGYAVLSGITTTPDLYACAVAIAGPTNLVTMLNTVAPYWKPTYNTLVRQIGGDPTTDEDVEFLKSRSPLFKVANITRPVLIAHGGNDKRVNKNESEQFVAALRQANKPFTYMMFPDEGHGLSRPENNIAFFAEAERFLAECLGGQLEPVSDELSRSTVVVEKRVIPRIQK